MNIQFENLIPDAVIVLANLMDEDGSLNFESRTRADMAIEIFKDKKARNLVTCGWNYRSDSDIKIAEAFRNYISSKFEVDSDSIMTELNSRDTVGDAFFTKVNFAKPLAWKHICVVTSNYHLKRTEEIFNFIYGLDFTIDFYGAEMTYEKTKILEELSSLQAFRETFSNVKQGDDEEIYVRLTEKHPFYNGKIYAKI